jgi:hypothetical protein
MCKGENSLKGDAMTSIPSEVIQRFASKQNMDLSEASQLFLNLEQFLDNASSCVASPSKVVDEAWHEFVLHTRQYADYCMTRYGRFIHHVPTSLGDCETECGTGVEGNVKREEVIDPKSADCSSDCSSCRSN